MTPEVTGLKKEIDAGLIPTFILCSWSSEYKNTMCALEDMGYATKHYQCGPDGEVDMVNWFYTGSKDIKVKYFNSDETILIKPNTLI